VLRTGNLILMSTIAAPDALADARVSAIQCASQPGKLDDMRSACMTLGAQSGAPRFARGKRRTSGHSDR